MRRIMSSLTALVVSGILSFIGSPVLAFAVLPRSASEVRLSAFHILLFATAVCHSWFACPPDPRSQSQSSLVASTDTLTARLLTGYRA